MAASGWEGTGADTSSLGSPRRASTVRPDIADRSAFHAARRVHASAQRLLWGVVAICVVGALAGGLLLLRSVARDASIQSAAEHGRRITQLIEQAGASAPRRDALLQAYVDQNRLVVLELHEPGGEPALRWAAATDAERPAQWSKWLNAGPELVELAVPARPGASGGMRLRLQAQWPGADQRLRDHVLVFVGVLGLAGLCALAIGLAALGRLRSRIGPPSSGGASGPSSSQSDASLSTILAEPSNATDGQAQPSEKRLRKLARLEGLLVTQARELDEWRRQAQVDPLTGLSNRRDAMARLYSALEGTSALGDAHLLLLRVSDLPWANRRVGYEVGDQILRALAAALRDQAERDDRAVCGRLNGSDFVLLRPGATRARGTAEALLGVLRPQLAALDAKCSVAIGVVAIGGDIDVARALSLADEALARAESGRPFSIAEIGHSPELVVFGDSVWQQRLVAALECRRTQLAGYPVLARDGQLLHLDCPMHVRFDEHGEHESASRWLAPATRGGLSPLIDLHVLHLALEAIAEDGQQRCVNVAAQSLASADFMVQATCAIEAAGDAAARLWVDIPESVAVEQRDLAVEVARRWWPLGVRVALEHAGERLLQVEGLGALGLDSVRIDSRFVSGLTGPESGAARRYAQGLVQLVHAAGLSISAEGVRLAGDLAVVWALGFDAATGPAVLKRGHSISPK